MKDELDYKYPQIFESLELNIKDYKYNRYQWTLKMANRGLMYKYAILHT